MTATGDHGLFDLAVHEAALRSRQDLELFLISEGLDQAAARDLSIRAYWRSMIEAGQIRTWLDAKGQSAPTLTLSPLE